MDLIKDLNKRTKLKEEFDDPSFDFDDVTNLPDHIMKQLVKDVKRLIKQNRNADPQDLVMYVIDQADLAGLEGEDEQQAVAQKILALL